jgi:hypothetical protein
MRRKDGPSGFEIDNHRRVLRHLYGDGHHDLSMSPHDVVVGRYSWIGDIMGVVGLREIVGARGDEGECLMGAGSLVYRENVNPQAHVLLVAARMSAGSWQDGTGHR